MRIAFLSTILSYPWGGADTLWTRAAEAARERGDTVFISVSPAVAQSPRVAALRASGAVIHERRPPTPGPVSPPARVLRRLRALAGMGADDGVVAALAAFRPDLVVVSLGGTYDLMGHPDWLDWLAATGTRVRLIANWQQENPILPDDERARALRALTLAERVYFVSTRNLASTRRHLAHALPHASVIQNPLRWRTADVAPFPPLPPRQLATASRLDEGKGIQLLLHALAATPDLPEWRLAIHGQGPAEAYLRQLVDHLQLGTRVTFRGYVRELRAIWDANHLLVSPAIEEGVPMTIPEAMLCERPVLATAVGGAEDWLRDGDTGFLCPAPTVPLLAATLRHAFTAADTWSEMGRRAADAARVRYLPDDFQHLITP
jgi:glycosyltransferase involved in cell wall biosynthesis